MLATQLHCVLLDLKKTSSKTLVQTRDNNMEGANIIFILCWDIAKMSCNDKSSFDLRDDDDNKGM